MEPSQVATLMQLAILTVFYMTAPMHLTGLAIGVGVSIFQAVTQIIEVTLVFFPKMMGGGLAMWISGAWIYGRFELFMMEVVATVSQISGGGY